MQNFYYVLFNTEIKMYLKDFNLFNCSYTSDLLNAFRFFDKDCAVGFLTDFISSKKQFRLKRVFLREFDVLCVI